MINLSTIKYFCWTNFLILLFLWQARAKKELQHLFFTFNMISMESIGESSNNGNVQRDDDYRKRILQSAYRIINHESERSFLHWAEHGDSNWIFNLASFFSFQCKPKIRIILKLTGMRTSIYSTSKLMEFGIKNSKCEHSVSTCYSHYYHYINVIILLLIPNGIEITVSLIGQSIRLFVSQH